jgi:hypothetical protein
MAAARVSKALERRRKTARDFIERVTTDKDKLVQGLALRVGPWVPTGGSLEMGALLEALIQGETQDLQRLSDADGLYQDELSDDAAALLARDEAVEEARRVLLDLKQSASLVFGVPYVQTLHLTVALPIHPEGVLRQLEQVLGVLGRPDHALPDPIKPGVSLDPSAFVPSLQQAKERLEGALSAVKREAWEANDALGVRQSASDAFDAGHKARVSLFNALGTLSGVDHFEPLSIHPAQ